MEAGTSKCSQAGRGSTAGRLRRAAPRLLVFAVAMAALRIVVGVVLAWFDLFISHEEDLARYWLGHELFRLVPTDAEPGRDYWYIEATPWLPLPLLMMNGLSRLGEWQLPAIGLVQGVITWLSTVLAGLLARHLAGGAWGAAWIAGAFLAVDPLFHRIGGGMLSEPIYLLSLIGMAYGAILLIYHPARTAESIFWIAVILGLASRYETWTTGALLLAVITAGEGIQGRLYPSRLVMRALGFALIPLAWMLFHWHAVGNPLGFLSLTRHQFGLNVMPQDRSSVVVQIVLATPMTAWLALGLAVAGLLALCRGHWSLRVVAALAIFQGMQVLVLTARGESGFSFVERFYLPMAILAVPAGAAHFWRLIEKGARAECCGHLETMAQAVFLVAAMTGVVRLGMTPSFLRQEQGWREVTAVVKALKPHSPAGVPLLYADSKDGNWNLVAAHIAASGRLQVMETVPPTFLDGAGVAPHGHAMLLRRETRLELHGKNERNVAYITKPWDIYVFGGDEVTLPVMHSSDKDRTPPVVHGLAK